MRRRRKKGRPLPLLFPFPFHVCAKLPVRFLQLFKRCGQISGQLIQTSRKNANLILSLLLTPHIKFQIGHLSGCTCQFQHRMRQIKGGDHGAAKRKRKNQQQDMFEYGRTELIEELANTDVLSMSPMDALNKLFLLREKARKL